MTKAEQARLVAWRLKILVRWLLPFGLQLEQNRHRVFTESADLPEVVLLPSIEDQYGVDELALRSQSA